MKRSLSLALAGMLSLSAFAANNARDQFSFAEQLLEDGDEAFALLEYKRFFFDWPKDAQAPEALYRIAQLELSHQQRLDKSQATLRRIQTQYPRSATAAKAKAFADYVEINSDFGGQPLLTMLAARANERSGKAAEAASQYESVIRQFPKARLAPDAARDLAALQLSALNKPADAANTVAWFKANHPKHELLPEVELIGLDAIQAQRGSSPEIAAAYRKLAQAYPKHDIAKEALEKAAAAEKEIYAFKRQFDKQFVRTYEVKQQGYSRDEPGRYLVDVELPKDCSARETKATLEEILVTEGGKRSASNHSVRVRAYFSYPITEAGDADWTPGKDPDYSVAERESEDVIKDVFIDLLKRRR